MVLVFVEEIIRQVSVLFTYAGQVLVENIVFRCDHLLRFLPLLLHHSLDLVWFEVSIHANVAKVLEITLDIRSISVDRV